MKKSRKTRNMFMSEISKLGQFLNAEMVLTMSNLNKIVTPENYIIGPFLDSAYGTVQPFIIIELADDIIFAPMMQDHSFADPLFIITEASYGEDARFEIRHIMEDAENMLSRMREIS